SSPLSSVSKERRILAKVFEAVNSALLAVVGDEVDGEASLSLKGERKKPPPSRHFGVAGVGRGSVRPVAGRGGGEIAEGMSVGGEALKSLLPWLQLFSVLMHKHPHLLPHRYHLTCALSLARMLVMDLAENDRADVEAWALCGLIHLARTADATIDVKGS